MSWFNGLIILIVGVVLIATKTLLPPPLSSMAYLIGVILTLVGLVVVALGLLTGPRP